MDDVESVSAPLPASACTPHHPPRTRSITADVLIRLSAQLDTAEALGRCLVPATRADREALRRWSKHADCPVIMPARNLYIRASLWETLRPDERAAYVLRGLLAQHPSWAACSYSAALLWGLDVPWALAPTSRIVVPRPIARTQGIAARVRSTSDRIERIGAYRATSFAQTIFECLRDAPFSLALAIADAACKRPGATASFVDFIDEAARGRPGAQRARFVAAYADARADNGGESRARGFFIENGYALPELQVPLPDPTDARGVFYVDFFWLLATGRIVVGEFDGRQKYRDPAMLGKRDTFDALLRERQRESRLTLLGYPVLRFTYGDLTRPARLHRLLAAAGIPRDAGREQEFRAAWKRVQR